jgi:hypothetical protein
MRYHDIPYDYEFYRAVLRCIYKTMRSLLLLPVILIFFYCLGNIGCREEGDWNIPYIRVDTTIDISSSMFHQLEFIGGWGYISSGYKGIFIYHKTENEFVALERCCTYDPTVFEAKVYYDPARGTLKDTVCRSEFQPFFDGGVSNGPATLPLRPYRTQYFDGVVKKLRIFN